MEGLTGLAAGVPGADVVAGRAQTVGKTAFVFPGQGAQWLGMGAQLCATAPVFAEHIHRCERALREHVEWSLLDVLRGAPGAPGLDRVDVVQPALWAVMVSLAELWRSVGVVPDAVIGHSQGEIAAAYVAGALSLRDAAAVVALRSRLLVRLGGAGGMVSLACGQPQAEKLASQWGDRLNIAAVNGVSSVVLAGETDAVTELMQRCEAEGIRARRIDVDYASHSAQVDAIREELIAALRGIEPRTSTVAFFSTVTGELMDTAGVNAEYWYRSIRQPVQFERAVRNAFDGGYRVFVESSPHPVLIAGIEETLVDCDRGATGEPIVIPTLGRDDGGVGRFWLSAGQAHVAGVGVDWRAAFADLGGRRVELPTYAFARQLFWLDGLGAVGGDLGGVGLVGAEHGLLAAVVQRPDSGGVVLTGRISVVAAPWLADHAVGPVVLFPGTGFVELALRAGDEVGCSVLQELTLQAPLVLPADGVRVQVVVGGVEQSGTRNVWVYSTAGQADSSPGWTCTRRACWGLARCSRPRSCRCGRRLGHGRWTSPTGIRCWRRGGMGMGRRFGVCRPCGGGGPRCSPTSLSLRVCRYGGLGFIRRCWMRRCMRGELSRVSSRRCCRSRGRGCVCTQAGLRGSVCDWRRWAGGRCRWSWPIRRGCRCCRCGS